MKVGDRLELNGRLVQVDVVIDRNNFAFHEVKETVKAPEKVLETPKSDVSESTEVVSEVEKVPEKKVVRRRKV